MKVIYWRTIAWMVLLFIVLALAFSHKEHKVASCRYYGLGCHVRLPPPIMPEQVMFEVAALQQAAKVVPSLYIDGKEIVTVAKGDEK